MWWQVTINRAISAILFFEGPHLELEIMFHFTDFGLRFNHSVVLHRELVSSNSALDSRCERWHDMSRRSKRPWLLQPCEISGPVTLILTKRECQATSVQLWEVPKMCQGCHNLNRTTKQPVFMKSSSLISSSASDDEDASECGPGEQIQWAVTLKWTPLLPSEQCSAHIHRGPRGKEDSDASHINDGWSPLSVFHSVFCRTNCYYQHYTHRLDDGPSPEPVVNLLTPNDDYSGRTALLNSKCCILYIYSTNIGTEYFKHGIYSPVFPLQNAVCFIILTYLVPLLFTFYIQVC